jgi:hypothetical protein
MNFSTSYLDGTYDGVYNATKQLKTLNKTKYEITNIHSRTLDILHPADVPSWRRNRPYTSYTTMTTNMQSLLIYLDILLFIC